MVRQAHTAHTGPERDQRYSFIEAVDGRLNFETHLVLVVDDEPSVRQLVCRQIKAADSGVLTVEAGHGVQAIEKLSDIRRTFKVEPLFIVTDLKMPVMDGWELLEALEQDYLEQGLDQGIPVIALSSTSGEKRAGLSKATIHGSHCSYVPLVSVAKEDCVAPEKYDATGPSGLASWVRHFLQLG